ncbi:damage-inducible protein DinB [Paenibacillus sp. PK3_47]|uniref:DinB family protein n=1 Tax=Paenibacillus sp. PK3_47 TaxID=2072642 RepID=UPI00201DE778|nr:DinB family protein [Paenibacillus sp. PK3_47]UQZ37282.1 damage-inducible protein DinB [Paenibacillus sp. PK3_47]
MTNHALEMYNYHVWANGMIMGRIKELPPAVLSQEVNSSFPTLAHALSHIYAVDKMWYLVVTGTGMPEALESSIPLNTSLLQSVEEYESSYTRLTGQFREWLQNQGDLEQRIPLDNPFAGHRETSFAEIVLHTVNHGTYHRGNISTMLRQLGHASVMNDYSLFWYQQPAVERNL